MRARSFCSTTGRRLKHAPGPLFGEVQLDRLIQGAGTGFEPATGRCKIICSSTELSSLGLVATQTESRLRPRSAEHETAERPAPAGISTSPHTKLSEGGARLVANHGKKKTRSDVDQDQPQHVSLRTQRGAPTSNALHLLRSVFLGKSNLIPQIIQGAATELPASSTAPSHLATFRSTKPSW
jgi:hypothetical protein